MSFESFEAPEIVPDKEQAEVWKNVRKHFEAMLATEEESPIYDDEAQERIREVLAAIEEQDYSKAFEHLEREISDLRALSEAVRENESARKVGTPELLKGEIDELESLRNSLIFEER